MMILIESVFVFVQRKSNENINYFLYFCTKTKEEISLQMLLNVTKLVNMNLILVNKCRIPMTII